MFGSYCDIAAQEEKVEKGAKMCSIVNICAI